MTTQSAIAGQSIGTSTNTGDDLFSISPLTLAASTTAFVVNMQITSGAGPTGPQQDIRVYYTTTIRTVTSALAPQQLGPTARFVELRVPQKGGQVAIRDSSLEPVTGSKFHCWVSCPGIPTAASLTVDLIELP